MKPLFYKHAKRCAYKQAYGGRLTWIEKHRADAYLRYALKKQRGAR